MEFLDGNKSHPSAEEIYSAIKPKYPMMSFATVYNTLDALKKIDAVWDLSIDDERKRYDPNTHPHNHLICVKCRRIEDIPAGPEMEAPESLPKGYKILLRHVEYHGICPECLEAEAD